MASCNADAIQKVPIRLAMNAGVSFCLDDYLAKVMLREIADTLRNHRGVFAHSSRLPAGASSAVG